MARVIQGPELKFDSTISLHKYIEEKMRLYEEQVAQVDAASGRTVTYGEMLRHSALLGAALVRRGTLPGHVVAVCSRNCLEYCWVLLAVLRTGASCQLIAGESSARELQHFLSIASPRRVICSVEVAQRVLPCGQTVAEMFLDTDCVQEVLVWGNGCAHQPSRCTSLAQLISSNYQQYEMATETTGENGVLVEDAEEGERALQLDYAQHVSFVLSSSGTTGLPKGVMLTHANVVAALVALGSKFVSQDDIVLGLMPFCHAYGLCLMLMYLCHGAQVVVLDKFNADMFSRIIPQYQISSLHLVPSLLSLLCKDSRLAGTNLDSVRHLWTGASHVSPSMQRAVRSKLAPHVRLHHCYGLTETTFTMLTGESRPDKPASPGTLCPGMLCKVVDVGTCRLLGPGEIGELCFRGPLLMKGYMQDDKATQEAIDADGWLHTGDLGYYDADSYFFIVDRLKEIIKYQGYQISPSELEGVLLAHPGVKEVAVVGVPHEVYGEVPRAYVVKQPGTGVNPADIEQYLDDEVSPFKKLRGGVKFVEFLPKTALGKNQRSVLKKQLEVLEQMTI